MLVTDNFIVIELTIDFLLNLNLVSCLYQEIVNSKMKKWGPDIRLGEETFNKLHNSLNYHPLETFIFEPFILRFVRAE